MDKKTKTTKSTSNKSVKKTSNTSTKNIKKPIKKDNKVNNTKTKTIEKNNTNKNKINKSINIKELFNKKNIIIISIILLLIISLICIFNSSNSPENNNTEGFSIKYENDKVINLSKVKKGTIYKNNIIVTNKSDKDINYSVKWINVKNTFKEQNKLLYKLDTTNSEALYIGDSQVPIANFTLSDKVLIRKGTSHKYTVYVYFKGDSSKEKNSTFKGIIEMKEIK